MLLYYRQNYVCTDLLIVGKYICCPTSCKNMVFWIWRGSWFGSGGASNAGGTGDKNLGHAKRKLFSNSCEPSQQKTNQILKWQYSQSQIKFTKNNNNNNSFQRFIPWDHLVAYVKSIDWVYRLINRLRMKNEANSQHGVHLISLLIHLK